MITDKLLLDLSSKNPDVVKNYLEAILAVKYILNKKGMLMEIKKIKSKNKTSFSA
jgi:hypothetical protein